MLRTFVDQEEALREYHESEAPQSRFPLADSEMEALKDMINNLAPVEEAIRRLSTENLTLRQADLALEVTNRGM